jgi:hypothetical protein
MLVKAIGRTGSMALCLWRCKTKGRRARTLSPASDLALPAEMSLDRKNAATKTEPLTSESHMDPNGKTEVKP